MFERYFTAYDRLRSLGNLERSWSYISPDKPNITLVRVRQLLKRLGNPEAAMRYVHVTGTSGKGSVTHLMHEILRRSGEKVASLSSPHTTTYLERFRIDDKLAKPEALAHATEDVLAAHEDHLRAGHEPLSFLDLSACIAFLLFQRSGVDWCVLEVGMGGKYDATNVISAPAVAIITNIDLDHTRYLGTTKSLIAKEKAGIIKRGSLVVTGATDAGPLKAISAAAKKAGAPMLIIPDETGDHLEHNADICRAAGLLLGMSPLVIEVAIENTPPLPCRLEIIQEHPRVIIDGAHNAAKMRATVQHVKRLQKGKVHVIFGCKWLKDTKTMAREVATIATSVHTTRFTGLTGKPENPVELLKRFPKEMRHGAFLFPSDAFAAALKRAKKSDTILITGSLYLAGELRTHWRTEKQILKERKS
jgi:dihydrofolate synthase / folylpolyglutamate synthase